MVSQRAFIEATTFRTLFSLRRWVFRIDTDTKRRIVPTRYRAGTQFLEAALRVAKESDIRVLLYNCPLRKEVKIPYFDSEYSRFREYFNEYFANISAERRCECPILDQNWRLAACAGLRGQTV